MKIDLALLGYWVCLAICFVLLVRVVTVRKLVNSCQDRVNQHWVVTSDHGRYIVDLQDLVEEQAKIITRLSDQVVQYREVAESVLKQEVEIQRGINATNEKLLEIISAAGEIERGRAEIALMNSEIDRKNGLIEEDIKRVYGRISTLERKIVTKNLHEKCNTAEEVGECTEEKS